MMKHAVLLGIAAAWLLVSCQSADPTQPLNSACLQGSDLMLQTGNWWVYEATVTDETNLTHKHRDSLVVVGTLVAEGIDAHLLYLYRNGAPMDTLMISAKQDRILAQIDLITTHMQCHPDTKAWIDLKYCSAEPKVVWEVTRPGDTLPSVDTSGSVVTTRLEWNHKASLWYSPARYTVLGVELDAKTVNMDYDQTMRIVEPPAAVLAINGRKTLTQWLNQKIGVVPGKGIVYWEMRWGDEMGAPHGCSSDLACIRTLVKTYVQ